jgi:uncharacterized protein YbjT (DUF2867 family)
MKIAIAGGHGTIALHLTRLLSDTGHEVVSIVRNPEHEADVADAGGQMVVADLEAVTPDELADAIGEADVAVFAAGAGPGSGAERKDTVDHLGAVKLVEAARRLGVDHYVIVSSMGADPTHVGDEVFDAYLVAKGRADDAVRSSGLPFTIVRPTSLTDDDAVGTVTLAESANGGPVTRADVAAVLAALIERAGRGGRTLELTGGDTPIADAVASVS